MKLIQVAAIALVFTFSSCSKAEESKSELNETKPSEESFKPKHVSAVTSLRATITAAVAKDGPLNRRNLLMQVALEPNQMTRGVLAGLINESQQLVYDVSMILTKDFILSNATYKEANLSQELRQLQTEYTELAGTQDRWKKYRARHYSDIEVSPSVGSTIEAYDKLVLEVARMASHRLSLEDMKRS